MKELPAIEVDGRTSTEQWPLDRGLQFGDGLFETMMVRNGRIRFLALHQQRLAEGCRRLDIRLDATRLWQQATHFAAAQCATDGPECLLKLLVTRGTATARGYRPSGEEQARSVLYRFAAPATSVWATEATPPPATKVMRLGLQLGENPSLAGIKHCNRLELVLAARQLQGHDVVDGLLADSSGRLVSGTLSNVFVRRRGKWMTPEVDRCGIAGIMRAVVLREAAATGQPVAITALPWTALDDCEALCLSNVRLGLLPVAQIDGRPLAQDGWALRLRARIGELDE